MKVKLINPAVYGGVHYHAGDVVEVDENWGKYTCGMGHAEEVKASKKEEPVPVPESPSLSKSVGKGHK